MRYLVRSYVTSPTTIKAITEIPANTPSPIGNTWIFCPGTAKAADADAEGACSAAEAAAGVAPLPAEVFTSVAGTDETGLADIAPPLPLESEDAEDVAPAAPAESVAVACDAGTDDTPLTLRAPPPAAAVDDPDVSVEDDPDVSVEEDPESDESVVEVVEELDEPEEESPEPFEPEPLLFTLLIVTVQVLTS